MLFAINYMNLQINYSGEFDKANVYALLPKDSEESNIGGNLRICDANRARATLPRFSTTLTVTVRSFECT